MGCNIIHDIALANQYIAQGQVIAYPTEAVYGLGCDPFNQQAVERILALKRRPMSNGFILLIADWSQLFPLIRPISDESLKRVEASWPGPVTWIFPKSERVPAWISGQHEGVAIRMSAHPLVKRLCAHAPLVSTSANIRGQMPARDLAELELQFPEGLDSVLQGSLGSESTPSKIYDVLTGNCLR